MKRDKRLTELSRTLRREQTSAEQVLWSKLCNRQMLGYKFRRQHQVGKYIADFLCAEQMFIVEVDGDIHAEEKNIKHDRAREESLKNMRYRLIRCTNVDVRENLEGVLEYILWNLEHDEDPSP